MAGRLGQFLGRHIYMWPVGLQPQGASQLFRQVFRVAAQERDRLLVAAIDAGVVHVDGPHARLAVEDRGHVGIRVPDLLGRRPHVGDVLPRIGPVQGLDRGRERQDVAGAQVALEDQLFGTHLGHGSDQAPELGIFADAADLLGGRLRTADRLVQDARERVERVQSERQARGHRPRGSRQLFPPAELVLPLAHPREDSVAMFTATGPPPGVHLFRSRNA